MTYKVLLTLRVYNPDRSNHLRGELEVTLPFPPQVGMHIEHDDMEPLQIKRSTWRSQSGSFQCMVEPEMPYEFDRDSDIDELTDVLDVLRDAKRQGWKGLDKIYRDK